MKLIRVHTFVRSPHVTELFMILKGIFISMRGILYVPQSTHIGPAHVHFTTSISRAVHTFINAPAKTSKKCFLLHSRLASYHLKNGAVAMDKSNLRIKKRIDAAKHSRISIKLSTYSRISCFIPSSQ